MLKKELTMVINTCNKFSDLWEPHCKLLNKNWKDREIRTLLVTDEKTEFIAERVEVISAGEGTELSQRLKYALDYIDTEYILVTLDDYFPIYPINTDKIEKVIQIMKKNDLDYVRLFERPNSNKRLDGNIYWIDLNSKKDTHYQINLYAGIWKKEFLERAVKDKKNAWEFELSLTKLGRSINAKCAMSKGKEFEILDVVRKGQLLHKSNRYLKKHGIYTGNRTVISWKEEIKLQLMKLTKSIASQNTIDFGKRIMRKRGHHFYSDDI